MAKKLRLIIENHEPKRGCCFYGRLKIDLILLLTTTLLQGCGVYDLATCLSDQKPPPPFNQSLNFEIPENLKKFTSTEAGSTIQHEYMVLQASVKDHIASPVLLLHELPGLTKKTLHFANWLSVRGFTVYVPVLFGEVGERSNAGGFINYFTSQEWIPFVETTIHYRYMDGRVEEIEGETRPLHQWLRRFVKEVIEGEHPRQAIGVIGMCLTGTAPLALLDNPKIQRVVVAQPTLPFMFWGTDHDKKSLGLSALELNNTIKRVKGQGIRILGTRFLYDCLAKREKHAAMKEMFGNNFIDEEIVDYVYSKNDDQANVHDDADDDADDRWKVVRRNAHSTLVGEWEGVRNHPSEQLRKRVASFLAGAQTDFVDRFEISQRPKDPKKKFVH